MTRIGLAVVALSLGACQAKDLTAGERRGTGGATAPIVCPAGTPSLQLLAGALGGLGTLDGVGAAARFNSPTRPTLDGAGNLYVIESTSIRKVSLATGAVTRWAGSANQSGHADGVGSAARFNILGPGFASDRAGGLYVWDFDSMRRIDTETAAVTTLPLPFGRRGLIDSMAGGPGFLYLMNCGWIGRVQLTTGEERVVTNDPAGDCGVSKRQWIGITADTAPEALYLTNGNTLRQISIDTGENTVLAGTTNNIAAGTDGVGTAASVNTLSMSSDGVGHLYFTGYDFSGEPNVRRLDLATRKVTTLAFLPTSSVFGVELVSDRDGSVYLVYDSVIHKLVPATGALTTIAGAVFHRGDVDGRGDAARFSSPGGITVGPAGNLYVLDGVDLIRKVAVATGEVTTTAKRPVDPVGTLTRAIVSDSDGDLYVVTGTGDDGPTQLSQIEMNTAPRTVTQWQGNHRGVYAIATDGYGRFFTVHGDRTIAVTERGTGVSRILAGRTDNDPDSTGRGAQSDGIGTAAGFAIPQGIVSDGANALFVADGRLIRRIDVSTGEVTTAANFGPSSAVFPGHDFLEALTRDAAGNLYVVDDSSIRKLTMATGEITTVAGAPGEIGVALGCAPRLNYPTGLAALPDGRIAVVDYYENAVLLLSP